MGLQSTQYKPATTMASATGPSPHSASPPRNTTSIDSCYPAGAQFPWVETAPWRFSPRATPTTRNESEESCPSLRFLLAQLSPSPCCAVRPRRRPKSPLASERRLSALMGTSTTPPMTARPTAITGPTGSMAAYSLEQAPGSTAPRTSTAMSITAMTLITVTQGPLPGRGAEPFNHFQGNEARDGKGHVVQGSHAAGNEHALPGHQSGGHSTGHH